MIIVYHLFSIQRGNILFIKFIRRNFCLIDLKYRSDTLSSFLYLLWVLLVWNWWQFNTNYSDKFVHPHGTAFHLHPHRHGFFLYQTWVITVLVINTSYIIHTPPLSDLQIGNFGKKETCRPSVVNLLLILFSFINNAHIMHAFYCYKHTMHRK